MFNALKILILVTLQVTAGYLVGFFGVSFITKLFRIEIRSIAETMFYSAIITWVVMLLIGLAFHFILYG